MSTRLSLAAMGSIGRVQSPPEAIEFATKVKAWCNTNGIAWWYSCVVSEHHSEEAKAKNIRDKARAQRLGYLKQIEIASGKRGHVDSSQHACCKKKHVNIIQKCMLHN